MPTPRKSYAQAELHGSTAVNKSRFADRQNAPATVGSIGDAPKHFKAPLKKVWNEVVSAIPDGVAGSADRIAVEMASRLLHQFRTDPDMQASKQSNLMNLLSRLGLDPQARTRLQVSAPQESKPASAIDQFLQALPDASNTLIH